MCAKSAVLYNMYAACPVHILICSCVPCYRSAALCSSAVERATYCRAPFLALVCPISHGVAFSPSALVSTLSACIAKTICIVKWKKHNLEQNYSKSDSDISCTLPWPHTSTLSFFFSSTIFFFLSVAPLIPFPAHLVIPTLTCFS